MNSRKRESIRYGIVFSALVFLFFVVIVININTGAVSISLGDILKIIFLRDDTDISDYNIIWKIRLPRLLTAALLGGALSLSGFLLQTFFRNPIAGPFVLGISSGAKMFLAIVTIALSGYVSSLSVSAVILAAFAGSMLSMVFDLMFAGKLQNMSMLLVIGIMIGYICSAVTDFMINFANDNQIVNLTNWSMGTFSGASWSNLKAIAAIVLFSLAAVVPIIKPMSAYALGEGYAQSMGVNIKLFRIMLILLSSLLSACVTAFAGPISFVGIAVPHICRIMLRTQKPAVMVPAVFICGSVFCMICDLIARTLFAPTELSLGTVTSIIGAPVVIWLMISRRKSNER